MMDTTGGDGMSWTTAILILILIVVMWILLTCRRILKVLQERTPGSLP